MTTASTLIMTRDGTIAQTIGAPAPREPVAVTAETDTRGRRVILQRPEGHVYDHRATSNPEVDERGRLVVNVTTEEAYWRWAITGERPAVHPWPVRLVHVEG